MSASEQIGTGAKSFSKTAKPLFIGSIPIAASNLFCNSPNNKAATADVQTRGLVTVGTLM
jgi:hypothetical protein